jgi:FKBP-type peptidyl-prolyl cis-trans isomerases 1
VPRRLALLAVPAVFALGGCAVTPPSLEPLPMPTAVEDACAAPGTASDAVAVSGALGASPVISADGPFEVSRVERTVLLEGDGEPVDDGDYVEVAITMVNATTGDQAPGTAHARVLVADGAALPGLLATIRCTPVGSRVVGVVPSESAYGTAGQPELAIGPGDDIVFVVDVLALVPLQASGEPLDLPEDFPGLGIDVAPDGRPTVRIPEAEPPTELRAAVLIEGTGARVADGDEVLVQFQAVNWTTGEVFDETWGDAPRSLLTILPGVDASLLGRTVGSRIVVVVPPADGFGSSGSPSSGVAGTDTVVYVVDILATTPAPA